MSSYAGLIESLLHEHNSNFGNVRLLQKNNESNYDSILIYSEMTAYRPKVEGALFGKIKENGKRPYIAFRMKYRYWFDDREIPTWYLGSDKEFFRVDPIDFLNAVNMNEDSFGELAAHICADSMSFPKFGCCSQYQQCSDIGKCVHEDLLYSSACEYRRNLEAGRNFYKKSVPINEKIAVIDIETPNRHHDSICSIGIVVIENGVISDRIHYLINPESHFDESNINIHHITAFDVADKPTFPAVWEDIKEFFTGYLLAGYNLGFDLSVIKKTMQRYQIEAAPAYYIDTLSLSRRYVKDSDNYQLSTLCRYFGISLNNHHDALCDSTATAELLLKLLSDFYIDIDKVTKKYSFDDISPVHSRSYSESTKALQELQGVLYGVICDGMLNDNEIYSIRQWLFSHKDLKGNYPYDKIYSTVEEILADSIITDEERKELFALINTILNPVDDSCPDVCVQIDGSTFCLTGEFECMSKMDLSALIENMGGIVKKNVTKTLDYLFVGSKGSDQWSQGNYGNKVKKAMEYNDKGASIAIVKETDIMPIILDE